MTLTPLIRMTLALVAAPLVLSSQARSQSPAQQGDTTPYTTVFYRNGPLNLEAYLYKPNGTGPFPVLLPQNPYRGAGVGLATLLGLGEYFVQRGYIYAAIDEQTVDLNRVFRRCGRNIQHSITPLNIPPRIRKTNTRLVQLISSHSQLRVLSFL